MARTPNDYWEERQTELMKRLEKGTEKTIDSLVEVYEQATKNINKEIVKIFKKYAKDSNLPKEELLKLLSNTESEEFYKELLEKINTIKDKDLKRKLLAEYNSSAYSYRITRYEALQQNIDIELNKLASIEQEITKIRYIDTINETYYRNIFNIQQNIGFYFQFNQINTKIIDLLLSENWYNKSNYSKRIWKNKQKLGNYLKIKLTADELVGIPVNRIAKKLSEYMNVGLYNATTLIRTEVNHFANEAEVLSYKECEIEKYRFIATLDKITCSHCAKLDNKEFVIKDRKTGENFPPIHPNDRCTTVPVIDNNIVQNLQRRAKDENGKAILVPEDMNYQEWYDKYINKDEGIIDNLLSNKNKVKLKDITNQKSNIIDQSFKNKNIKNIAHKSNVKSIKLGGNKAYHRNGTIVLRENYSNRTAIHEFGHLIDYNNKWLSSKNSFKKAIKLDKEKILKNADIYKKLIKNNSNYKELSDIIGGMTNNKIVGRYKHKNKYWKKENKLEREVFAQMFTMAGNNDFKQLEIFKSYFPNTFKEFDNLIKEIL